MNPIRYIFDPDAVKCVLDKFPSILGHVSAPSKEGVECRSFAGGRKTSRQIYRVLSNPHYPHLHDLLTSLERCIAGGWKGPRLLRTRGTTEFQSAVSELFAAEWFLKNRFSVVGLDESKGSDPAPDLLVKRGLESLVLEVYSPRDWDGLEQFEDELRLGILNADVPKDFDFEVTMNLMRQLNSKGHALWFDPWSFSKATETPELRLTRLEPMWREIEEALTQSPTSEAALSFCDESQNLAIGVQLRRIQTASHLPSRSGFISFPTLTGYAPEAMFEALVKRRITTKLRKRQASHIKGNHLRALLVDVSFLGYVQEFEHPYYRPRLHEVVRRYLDLEPTKTDLLAFCRLSPASSGDSKVLFELARPGHSWSFTSLKV